MMDKDKLLKQHNETYYEIKRKVVGLYSTSSALKIRAGILKKRECVDLFEEVENNKLSELLDLHSKTLDEIAQSIKENLDKFVEEENEMLEVIEVQIRELNTRVDTMKG